MSISEYSSNHGEYKHSQEKLPHVAIVIATYNNSQFIINSVRSALVQDYPNLSLVIVDDGSTDNTIEAIFGNGIPSPVKSSEEKDIYEITAFGRKITYIRLKHNQGPSYARNQAIEYSWDYAEYYAILDADDEMVPEKVSKCISRLLTNPAAAGAYGDYFHHNVHDQTLSYESKRPYNFFDLQKDCIVHSGSVIRKSALERVKRLYNPNLRTCEDYNLYLILGKFFIFDHIAEPLTIVRIHGNNSTDYVDQKSWNENYQLCFYDAFQVHTV